MRYAIFSDIHSNLQAYEAVLEAFSHEEIDQYLCVGDIVGYGADPKECIERTKKLKAEIVCGNHDWAAVALTSIEYFNPIAKEAVLWTKESLDLEEQHFLKSLRLVEIIDELTLVHGTLTDPEEFDYLLDLGKAKETFSLLKTPLCFIGHSHAPVIFQKEGENISYTFQPKIEVIPEYKYIINVGSVGQPRDGDSRAAYCLYDTEARRLEIKRVGYDIKKAQEKIMESGLPIELAMRLEVGR